MIWMDLSHMSDKSRQSIEDRAIDAIIKRMFQCIRGRVLYHPDQLKSNRKLIPPAEGLIGLSRKEFREYMTALFRPGMTFYNWGTDVDNQWQLDHTCPVSAFDVQDLEQVKRLSHYTNLRPMWGEENQLKWNILPASMDGVHMLHVAYADIPGDFSHLPIKTYPHLPGLEFPIHDGLTQLRIAYAYADRKKSKPVDDKDVIHIRSKPSISDTIK
jgi:hypothetical protein